MTESVGRILASRDHLSPEFSSSARTDDALPFVGSLCRGAHGSNPLTGRHTPWTDLPPPAVNAVGSIRNRRFAVLGQTDVAASVTAGVRGRFDRPENDRPANSCQQTPAPKAEPVCLNPLPRRSWIPSGNKRRPGGKQSDDLRCGGRQDAVLGIRVRLAAVRESREPTSPEEYVAAVPPPSTPTVAGISPDSLRPCHVSGQSRHRRRSRRNRTVGAQPH